jgi:hypothetical protein
VVSTCVQDGSDGIVAKHAFGPYVTEAERTTRFKIKNRSYSQMQRGEELFERERHTEPVAGWHCCELVVRSGNRMPEKQEHRLRGPGLEERSLQRHC